MNSLLLDTNILLDCMHARRDGHAAAKGLVLAAAAGRVCLSVASVSLKDVYYIGCKYMEEATVLRWIDFFLAKFDILAVDGQTCRNARSSGEPDFEDGIIRAAAEYACVDLIVSRDADAFIDSSVRKADGEEALRLLNLS